MPVRLTSELFVRWNKWIDDGTCKVLPLFEDPPVVSSPWISPLPNTTTLKLELLVDAPSHSITDPELLERLYVEVAVFRKQTIGSETSRVADWTERKPWSASTSTYDFEVDLVTPTLSLLYPEGSDKVRFENLYIVMERLVIRDENDTMTVRALQAAFHGVQTSLANPNSNLLYLEDLQSDDSVSLAYVPCNGCLGTGELVGTVTPLSVMPDPATGPIIVQ
jgi:hypothetical protein